MSRQRASAAGGAVRQFGRFGLIGSPADPGWCAFSHRSPEHVLHRGQLPRDAQLAGGAAAACARGDHPPALGDFDLSIAGVMGVSAAVAGELLLHGTPPSLSASWSCSGSALVIGLINATLIVRLGMNAFVTTLGALTALEGAAYGITNNQVITKFPEADPLKLTQTTIGGGLFLATIYGWVLVIILVLHLRADARRQAAPVRAAATAPRRVSRGVPVNRVRGGAFVASSMITRRHRAGPGRRDRLASTRAASPQYLLQPFAAAFLGAGTIYIGRFNAIGTIDRPVPADRRRDRPRAARRGLVGRRHLQRHRPRRCHRRGSRGRSGEAA